MWNALNVSDPSTKEEQDELLNELYKQMFIVAYAFVRNKSDALDIVQESWVKILQKIETLRDKEKIIQWAKSIVANTSMNLIKHKSNKSMVDLDDNQHISAVQSVLSEIEDKLLYKAIRESLEQLDEDTRTMFIYKFFRDKKDREIAEIMGIPIGTVKARIHRGKDRLRVLLTEVYHPNGATDKYKKEESLK